MRKRKVHREPDTTESSVEPRSKTVKREPLAAAAASATVSVPTETSVVTEEKNDIEHHAPLPIATSADVAAAVAAPIDVSTIKHQQLVAAATKAASRIVPSLKLLELVSPPGGATAEDYTSRMAKVCAMFEAGAAHDDVGLNPSIRGFTPDVPTLLFAIMRFYDLSTFLGNTIDNGPFKKSFNSCLPRLIAHWDPTIEGSTKETILFPFLRAVHPKSELSNLCDIYKLLVQRGVDINARNTKHETFLLAYFKSDDIIFDDEWNGVFAFYFFAQLGADCNARDADNEDSILHVIVRNSLLRVMQLLIEHEHFVHTFDVFAVNRDNLTPRELANNIYVMDVSNTQARNMAHLLREYESFWHQRTKPVLLHAIDTTTPLIPDLAHVVLAYIEGPQAPQTPR